jgi:hypothetical protein
MAPRVKVINSFTEFQARLIQLKKPRREFLVHAIQCRSCIFSSLNWVLLCDVCCPSIHLSSLLSRKLLAASCAYHPVLVLNYIDSVDAANVLRNVNFALS